MRKIDLWLDGDNTAYNARLSGDQKAIVEDLCDKIRYETDFDKLNEIGDKLMMRGSNFIGYMLIKCDDIQRKHRVAALKAISKRRGSSYPSFIGGKKFTLGYQDLVALSPQKCLKIITKFISHGHIIWNLTNAEIDKLLFPMSIDKPEKVKFLGTKLKRIVNRVSNAEMKNILIEDEMNRCKDEKYLKHLITHGFYGISNRTTEQLEEQCYERGLMQMPKSK